MLFNRRKNRRIIEIIIDKGDDNHEETRDNDKEDDSSKEINRKIETKGDNGMNYVKKNSAGVIIFKLMIIYTCSTIFSLIAGNTLSFLTIKKFSMPLSLYSFVTFSYYSYMKFSVIIFLVLILGILLIRLIRFVFRETLESFRVTMEIELAWKFEVFTSFIGSSIFSMSIYYLLSSYNILSPNLDYLSYAVLLLLTLLCFFTYKWVLMYDDFSNQEKDDNVIFKSILKFISISGLTALCLSSSYFEHTKELNYIVHLKDNNRSNEIFNLVTIKNDKIMLKDNDNYSFRVYNIEEVILQKK